LKFKKIKEKENELEFELIGEDHTFSWLLLEELLSDKNVEIAQYNIPHPLTGQPVFYVKTKKGKPIEAVKKAAKQLSKEMQELLKQIK